MKKTVFLALCFFYLGSSQLFAQEDEKSDLYFGLDLFAGKSSYDLDYSGIRPFSLQRRDKDLDQDGFRVKFGAVLEDKWRIQGYFQHEDLQEIDNNIFSMGLDLIKGFEVAPDFEAFVLGGAGVHWSELDERAGVIYDEDYNTAVSLKLGVGAMYKITDTVEVLGGFDWQFRSWADMDVIEVDGPNIYAYTIEQEDISRTFYLGLNLHF